MEHRPASPAHRPPEQILLQEIQVLLAEKRTYFALFRLGIAIATLPLTIIAFLIATREYHQVFAEPLFAFVIIGSLSALSLVGISICLRTQRKIKGINGIIDIIKSENKRIAEILF